MNGRSARAAGALLLLAAFSGCGSSAAPVVEQGAPLPPSAPQSSQVVPSSSPPTTATPPSESVTTDTLGATDTPDAAPSTSTTAPPTVTRSGADVSAADPVGDPLSISIPSIGVESVLVPAGVLTDGTVAVPPDPDIAGWFTGGPRPGERGPAVIMGHVDSKRSGPGVFWHLVDLEAGDVVTVQTTTGVEEFVVQTIEQYPKDQFPTDRVYGPVPQPALRLITCGGSFDRSIGHYRDNIIAFLVPAAEA